MDPRTSLLLVGLTLLAVLAVAPTASADAPLDCNSPLHTIMVVCGGYPVGTYLHCFLYDEGPLNWGVCA